jgi:hypothetical protein
VASSSDGAPQRFNETDRDEAVRRVQEAFVESHLTREEMDQQLHRALTATTCLERWWG